jgi:hypothetical protein
VPFKIPGVYLICLLTYSIIPRAACPTDFIVKAEKAYGSIEPNNKQVKIMGSSNDIYPGLSEPKL